jgi:hypothetical protein
MDPCFSFNQPQVIKKPVVICEFSHTGGRWKRYCPSCNGTGLNITKTGEKEIPPYVHITYCRGP